MSQENVEMMRALYQAFNRGDIQVVLGKMDENIVWKEADGDAYVGPQAVLNGLFNSLGNNWDEFRVTPEEFLDAGDHIVTLGTYTGSNKATGVALKLPFAHVWGLKGGRLVRFQEYSVTRQAPDPAGSTS